MVARGNMALFVLSRAGVATVAVGGAAEALFVPLPETAEAADGVPARAGVVISGQATEATALRSEVEGSFGEGSGREFPS